MTRAEIVRVKRLIAQVDAIFDCGQPVGTVGSCVFPSGHDGVCIALPPIVAVCRLCRGRLRIPGTDHACTHCTDGLEP